MNLILLIRLLTAHFIADFIFQPNVWVKEKAEKKINSKYLYLHIFIILLLTYLAAWSFSFLWGVLIITVSHFLIDVTKSYIKKNTTAILIADQSLHIIIILVCWAAYTSQFPSLKNDLYFLFNETKFWLLFLAYIIVTVPSSVLINKFTSKWTNDIDGSGDSLKSAGMWIGIIERVLILTFILQNQFGAIGFLIAAKSIFRFGETKNNNQHKVAEYILIGTLLSFSIAILVGIALDAASKLII